MKFANSIKYINSFEKAPDSTSVSQKRIRELCQALGRVSLGMKYICLPESIAGHACALMLESVIKSAGYKVGRITSVADFDARNSVFIDRELSNIDDFNKAVAEIRAFVKVNHDEVFYKEEIVFALSLLLCRLADCTYVLLEGLSDHGYTIDAICAPYDLIVMPTVYNSHDALEIIKPQCEAIRRGTREVISGNQKSEVYNCISNACAISGVRLYIPVKSQLNVVEMTSKKLAFEYGGKEGYLLRSPSHLLRDCALTVIETSLAIRRDGVKLPGSAISQGLSAVTDSACFDVISVAPMIVADAASSSEEIGLLKKTCADVGLDTGKVSLCIGAENQEEIDAVILAFEGSSFDKLAIVSSCVELSTEKHSAEKYEFFCDVSSAAKNIYNSMADQTTPLICLGSLEFALGIKNEIVKLMSF